ncbi:MFS transporter [Uliginosibacterium paludis]|uniref:MFS transporter n=1 Tax=Uliginosibacterium paludis TaxID=1615952 RepID=A0ABV2CM13_9RHOO
MTGLTQQQPGSAGAEVAAPAYWSGVFAMSLCVFTLIASEFMPVSLLTPMAVDLQLTEGLVGQGISISGAFAVATSLCIPTLAGQLDRKWLLLALTALMAVSGAMVGMASAYGPYLAGRALIGVVVGGFWSLSAATAMRLVPPAQVGRALAIFNGGNALATVVAAPLGSYLGSVLGWRGAFLCLIPVALVTLVWQWASLPAMPAQRRRKGAGHAFSMLSSRPVALGMAACGAFFTGQFLLFTYVRPFLETVTHASPARLSLVLLAIGLAGLVGTSWSTRLLRQGLYRALLATPLLMALLALALIPAGAWIIPVTVLLACWGFLATAAPVGWWSWVAQAMPQDVEAGGGLMVAVIQLAIAAGSATGGLLFDTSGYRSTFGVSAAVLLLAALLAFLTARAQASRSPCRGSC